MPLRKLPRYVTSFVDRYGVERFRFRRGTVSVYLPPPGSKEFKAEYDKAFNGVVGLDRVRAGTVNDLVARFYRSIEFMQTGQGWQKTLRQVIEPFREKYGAADVREFRRRDFNTIIAAKLEQKVIKGKKVGGTHAAHRLRETLIRLWEFAVKEEMVERNYAKDSTPIKHKAKGFHTWTENDIKAYRERWPVGSRARLALELMLWTGMRRGNAHKTPPPEDGRFKAIAVKTGKEIDLYVTPQLKAAIDAMPDAEKGKAALIVNDYGRAYTAAGFSNKMREWCDKAGLPQCTSHGLRKALTTRAADLGLSQQELKAIGQWSGDDEVRIYAEKANRKRMAERGIRAVSEAELEGNIG